MTNFSQLFFRLSLKEKMLFARNLEVMIRSGLSLIQSLEILKKQARSSAFRKIVDQLIADVRNGQFLSQGLERYRALFGDFFINLVRVGEVSGTLGENLGYLAEELNKKQELQTKVRGAMVYPLIILASTAGITGILAFFVFPKILPVLKNINVPLPTLTVWFIKVSDLLFSYGHWILSGLVGLAVIWGLLLRNNRVRSYWQNFLLHLPGLNNLLIMINLVSLARTMGLLLRAGVQIVEALQITANTLTNLIYQREVRKMAEEVKQGATMSKNLTANTRLFPTIFSQMVLVGENTGKLDESLKFLADFYESELDETTKSLASFLEPMLLLVMGLVVGFVALAIITPIYKITQTLGR